MRKIPISVVACITVLFISGCGTVNDEFPTNKSITTSPQPVDSVNDTPSSRFDEQGYDVAGFDREGFDREGFDREGFDRWGRDKWGCNKFSQDKFVDKFSQDKFGNSC